MVTLSLPWPPSVHSKSLFTSSFLTLLLFGLVMLMLPVERVHATVNAAGTQCSMINGVYTCDDGSSPANACVYVDGVAVCSDGGNADTGTTCVTDNVTGKQVCLSGGVVGGTQTAGSVLGKGLGTVQALPGQHPSTGWLSMLTSWVANTLHTLFSAIAQLLKDLVTYALAAVLGLVAAAISSITPPDFLTSYSLSSLLGRTGPTVQFFIVQFRIPEGLALIGTAYGFRLLRKFLTAFQW